jgi:hypothetical protein
MVWALPSVPTLLWETLPFPFNPQEEPNEEDLRREKETYSRNRFRIPHACRLKG